MSDPEGQPNHLLVDLVMVFLISPFLAVWVGLARCPVPSSSFFLHLHLLKESSREPFFAGARPFFLGGKKKINIYRWTARPGLCAVTVAVLCCVWLYIGVHCTSFGTDKKEPLCRQISLMLAHTEQVTQSSVRWAAPALLDCFHAFELNSGFQHSKGYSISPSEISIVLLQRREPNPPLGRTQSLPNWLCEMSSAWRKSMELPSVSGSGMKSEWLLCPVLGYW